MKRSGMEVSSVSATGYGREVDNRREEIDGEAVRRLS
jgi:hypothetical protein